MTPDPPHFPSVTPQLKTSSTVYEAECAVTDSAACGAESGPHPSPEPVEAWMEQHTRESGHRRFLRVVSDYTGPQGAVVPGPCRHPRTERRTDGGTYCGACRRQLYL